MTFNPKFSFPRISYQRLLDKDDEENDEDTQKLGPTTRSGDQRWKIVCLLQTALITAMLVYFLGRRGGNLLAKPLIYSPARDALEYEVNVFHTGSHHDFSKYQGTSSDVDQAWHDLYNYGLMRISKKQAALLPNKTTAIPGDEDHYIIGLHVFHDLHCLNAVRQAIFNDHYHKYNMSKSGDMIHLSHCIDSLRKSIMCNPDLGTVVFKWEERVQRIDPQDTTAHQCAKFDNIAKWAKERKLLNGKWDNKQRPTSDDIKIPVYNADGSTQ